MSVPLKVPFIKAIHKQPYAGISPSRPELSQAGKTVLVLGGSISIGLAIAKAFVQASASHVIVTGRRQAVLDNAVAELKAEAKGLGTTITGIASDMADLAASEKLWNDMKHAGIVVDVLVLNGVTAGPAKPLLEIGLDPVWKVFETNVRALLDHTERFHKQEASSSRPKAGFLTVPFRSYLTWIVARRLTLPTRTVPGQPLHGRRSSVRGRGQGDPDLCSDQEFGHAAVAADCQRHRPQ
jgi:NAD(P)-dependent dehydrogenase (short-subunit alcohol dehydrogenase family)